MHQPKCLWIQIYHAEEVAKKAIKVASEICVFTNDNLNIEKI